MGNPPYLDLRWGTPPPPRKCGQTENITSRHPSDAGGNNNNNVVLIGNLVALRSHVYRAALQEIIRDKDPRVEHVSIKLTHKRAYDLPFDQ